MNRLRRCFLTLLILKRILIQSSHVVMSQRCLHRIVRIVILLVVFRALRIGPFAVDGLASERVSRLFQDFLGTLFVFEKNKTEWTSFLFDLIHGCFDLSDLEDKQVRACHELPKSDRHRPCRTSRSNPVVLRRRLRCLDHRRRLCEPTPGPDDGRISCRHVCLESRADLENKPAGKRSMETDREWSLGFTLSVESRSSKRTKPKPLERPDLSNFTVALSTLPNLAKYSHRCSRIRQRLQEDPVHHWILPIFVSGLSPPTKTFRVLKNSFVLAASIQCNRFPLTWLSHWSHCPRHCYSVDAVASPGHCYYCCHCTSRIDSELVPVSSACLLHNHYYSFLRCSNTSLADLNRSCRWSVMLRAAVVSFRTFASNCRRRVPFRRTRFWQVERRCCCSLASLSAPNCHCLDYSPSWTTNCPLLLMSDRVHCRMTLEIQSMNKNSVTRHRHVKEKEKIEGNEQKNEKTGFLNTRNTHEKKREREKKNKKKKKKKNKRLRRS